MNQFRQWITIAMALLVACLWTPNPALGQATTLGAITGTVKDSTGAVVSGASVTVTNQETKVTRKTSSNGSGFYVAEALPDGNYTITAALSGFKSSIVRNVHLDPGQRRGVDITLTVGSIAQQVMVQANAVSVDTESGESGGTISAKEVANLMLNGRNFQTLAQIVPGVSSVEGANSMVNAGYLGQTALVVNGSGIEQTTYTIDGVYDMTSNALINVNIEPSIDAIAEMRVLKDNYSARYGFAGSGQVLIDTKSGTDVFHGSAYEFIRSNSFGTARNFLNRTPLSSLHYNIFGYTLGGPVIIPGLYNQHRDKKTYFFAGGEWKINHYAASLSRAMFPQALRTGNFMDSPTMPSKGLTLDASSQALLAAKGINPGRCEYAGPDGRIDQLNPSCFDPTSVALMNAYWPLPNNPNAPIAQNYINNNPERDSQSDVIYRIDHQINNSNQLMGRVMYEEVNDVRPSRNFNDPAPEPGAVAYTTGLNAVVRWTSNFTPNLINSVSAAETFSKVDLLPTGKYTMPSGAKIQQAFPTADPLNRIPDITMSGIWSWLGVGAQPNFSHNGSGIISDDVSWVKGNNVFQFGGVYMFNIYRANANAFPMGLFNFSGEHTGDSAADYLLGLDTSYQQTNTQRAGAFHERWGEAYFQDDWKATPRLTLNLGIRYSYFSPTTKSGDDIANFQPSAFDPSDAPEVTPAGSLVVNGQNQPITPSGSIANITTNGMVQAGRNGTPDGFTVAKKNLFAPRIGFAYALTSDNKTSIHGGYGIGYTQVGLFQTESLLSNTPYVSQPTYINTLFSTPVGKAAPPGLQSLTAIMGDYRPATLQSYSLTLERQVFPNGVATLAYAGSTTQHIFVNDYDENFPLNGTSSGSAACAANKNNPSISVTDYDPCINLGTVSANYYRPYKGYAGIASSYSGGIANYNSLQAGFIYRHSDLQLNAAYTWSKALSDVNPSGAQVGYTSASSFQNPRDPMGDYGRPDFDRTNVFTSAWVYQIPYFMHSSNLLKRELLSRWGTSGLAVIESGFAQTPTLSWSYKGLATRPNQVGPVSYTKKIYPNYVSQSAFAAPSFGTFGNAGVGSIRAPGEVAFNTAIFKNIPVGSRVVFNLRAEAFNVFNHPNILSISTAYNPAVSQQSSGFGTPTLAGDPREMEFSFRASF